MENILKIKDLTVTIGGKEVLSDVDLTLLPGKISAIVGESGSGKTMMSLAILDLLPDVAARISGEILFRGKNIFDMDNKEKQNMRGNSISMVFQEPFTALNPVMRVGEQITETIAAHKIISEEKIQGCLKGLLKMVKLSEDIASCYPHELSGGMRQRIMLAIALSCDPEILILDEPTTALDVSVQKEILDLVMGIQKERCFSILFITHDFSIVNMVADEVHVMKNGRVIEKGAKEIIFKSSENEYTRHLIDCIPKLGDERERLPESE